MTAKPQMGVEPPTSAASSFVDYFRCPPAFAPFRANETTARPNGFFRFGQAVCFGKADDLRCAETPNQPLPDVLPIAGIEPGFGISLPFNPSKVIENLRYERYTVSGGGERIVHSLYYLVRPLLPFFVRKRLQQYIFQRRQ